MFVLVVVFAFAVLVGAGVYAVTSRPGAGHGAPNAAVAAARAGRHPWLRRLLGHHPDPAAATSMVLGASALGVAAGAVAVGALAGMVRTHTGFVVFDMSVTRFGAEHATSFSTSVLRLVTQLGGAVVLVPIAVAWGVMEVVRWRSWRPAAFLVVVVGGQFALANTVKAVVGRSRPDVLRLTGFSGPSFPSGHATASAAAFAAFALLVGKGRGRRTQALAAAVAAGLAAAVGATRVLLGVHWLTDVVAGWCLGWTWFAVCSVAFGGRLLRFGAPVAIAEDAVADELPTARLRAG